MTVSLALVKKQSLKEYQIKIYNNLAKKIAKSMVHLLRRLCPLKYDLRLLINQHN